MDTAQRSSSVSRSAIPVAFLALALTAGLVGALSIALAIIAFKSAIVGGIGYGLFQLARAVFAPSAQRPPARTHP